MFLNERLPESFSYGSTYSTRYAVDVVKTKGGARFARAIHPFVMFSQTTTLNRFSESDFLSQWLDLYHRVGGRAGGFRMRHLNDYSTNSYTSAPTATDQPLIHISDDDYQLVRWYGDENRRDIYKPVDGTVVVADDGAAVGFTVDHNTGIVTLDAAASGQVTGGCEFDIPCAFVTDMDDVAFSNFEAVDVSFSIEEILNPEAGEDVS